MNKDRFKFRVWDEVERRYHYNDFVVTATGYTAKAVVDSFERTYIDQTDMDYNRMVLEQCTGFRDCHGKLVYENDTVSGRRGCKYRVIWGRELCWAILQVELNVCVALSKFTSDELEVVGNFHENKGELK